MITLTNAIHEAVRKTWEDSDNFCRYSVVDEFNNIVAGDIYLLTVTKDILKNFPYVGDGEEKCKNKEYEEISLSFLTDAEFLYQYKGYKVIKETCDRLYDDCMYLKEAVSVCLYNASQGVSSAVYNLETSQVAKYNNIDFNLCYEKLVEELEFLGYEQKHIKMMDIDWHHLAGVITGNKIKNYKYFEDKVFIVK